ncbi:hypothetical protein GA0074692_6791 [Micromonospora pallida]|uniref:Uncharacterized protein n=1 Tax=Micromonospora pallida TaxID=145854 RepID=A0A1C6TNB2_9ACTN|nr:hypothetical protein GA0074692_6791 [Micromonospora pallida]
MFLFPREVADPVADVGQGLLGPPVGPFRVVDALQVAAAARLGQLPLGVADGVDGVLFVEARVGGRAGQIFEPLDLVGAGPGDRFLRGLGGALRVGQGLHGAAVLPLGGGDAPAAAVAADPRSWRPGRWRPTLRPDPS